MEQLVLMCLEEPMKEDMEVRHHGHFPVQKYSRNTRKKRTAVKEAFVNLTVDKY